MASFKGLYDKLISIIKTDTVVNSGSYSPAATDIIPVYDYAQAVDSGISGEKIAPKKFVRATDLGGGGSPSTENILYSRLFSQNNTNIGIVDSFTIPANTVPPNSMLYFEARAYSTTITSNAAWGISFSIGAVSLGQSGVTSKRYVTMIKLANINNTTGTANTVVGPIGNYPNDYLYNDTVGVSKQNVDWTVDNTVDLNLSGTLPAGGVTIQMFRIKLVTQTEMP